MAREQQPVHEHEDGWEEKPYPYPYSKSLRPVEQQQHVEELPSHAHMPEKVETIQLASDVAGASQGAQHGWQQYGLHEEGEDDACKAARRF